MPARFPTSVDGRRKLGREPVRNQCREMAIVSLCIQSDVVASYVSGLRSCLTMSSFLCRYLLTSLDDTITCIQDCAQSGVLVTFSLLKKSIFSMFSSRFLSSNNQSSEGTNLDSVKQNENSFFFFEKISFQKGMTKSHTVHVERGFFLDL